jgi:hypothetical protein
VINSLNQNLLRSGCDLINHKQKRNDFLLNIFSHASRIKSNNLSDENWSFYTVLCKSAVS